MLRYIVDKVKKDYKKLEKIIMDSKDKNDLVNKLRQENIVIDEYNNIVNIKKEELKIVVNTSQGVNIDKDIVENVKNLDILIQKMEESLAYLKKAKELLENNNEEEIEE